MCDRCGADHPEFEDVADEILFLDRAYNHIGDIEEARLKDDYSMSPCPYSVEFFARRIAETVSERWMVQKVSEEGTEPVSAVERLSANMLLVGFQIAMVTRSHWLATESPFAKQVAFPTEEETSAFKEEQQKRAAELAAQVPITKEQVLEALKQAGLDIPAHVSIIGLDELKDGGEKQTGDAEIRGGYL